MALCSYGLCRYAQELGRLGAWATAALVYTDAFYLCPTRRHIVMAYAVMAYIVMDYIVMDYIVMAFLYTDTCAQPGAI